MESDKQEMNLGGGEGREPEAEKAPQVHQEQAHNHESHGWENQEEWYPGYQDGWGPWGAYSLEKGTENNEEAHIEEIQAGEAWLKRNSKGRAREINGFEKGRSKDGKELRQ